MRKYNGAGVLFYRETEKGTEILLGKRSHNPYKGYWTIPGGGKKSKESFRDAAMREAQEELSYGANVDFNNKECFLWDLKPSSMVLPFFYRYDTFLVKVIKEPLGFLSMVNSEFEKDTMRWHPVNNLPVPLHPATKYTLFTRKKSIELSIN